MNKLLQVSAFVLALQPLASFAAPVTLQGTWQCGSVCAYPGPGVLTFTYDDTTTGVPSGNVLYPSAVYTNAITAATFTFASTALTFDSTGESRIEIRQGRDAGYDASIRFYLVDAGNTQYSFQAFIEDHSQTNGGVELSWLAGLKDDESTPAILAPIGANTNPPAGLQYWLQQKAPLTEVPVPAAAWLFGSALLGLAGFARRVET